MSQKASRDQLGREEYEGVKGNGAAGRSYGSIRRVNDGNFSKNKNRVAAVDNWIVEICNRRV